MTQSDFMKLQQGKMPPFIGIPPREPGKVSSSASDVKTTRLPDLQQQKEMRKKKIQAEKKLLLVRLV